MKSLPSLRQRWLGRFAVSPLSLSPGGRRLERSMRDRQPVVAADMAQRAAISTVAAGRLRLAFAGKLTLIGIQAKPQGHSAI